MFVFDQSWPSRIPWTADTFQNAACCIVWMLELKHKFSRTDVSRDNLVLSSAQLEVQNPTLHCITCSSLSMTNECSDLVLQRVVWSLIQMHWWHVCDRHTQFDESYVTVHTS